MLCYYNSTYTLVELKDIDKYYDSIGARERWERYNSSTKYTVSFNDYVDLFISKYTCDDFDISNKGNEWFDETFTTPNGEQVIAFGYYGYDG